MFKALLEFLPYQNSKQKKIKLVEARFYVIYTLKNRDDATKEKLIEIFHDNFPSLHLSSRTCHEALKFLLREDLITIINKRGNKSYAIVKVNQIRTDVYADQWLSYCTNQLPKSEQGTATRNEQGQSGQIGGRRSGR